MQKKVLIIAGEASGDYHGANLVKSLKNEFSDIEFFAVGGEYLKGAGVNVLFDFSSLGVIGIWEAFKILPKIWDIFNKVKKTIFFLSPDLVIFIDSAAVNVRLAKFCKDRGFKSIYYFPPSAWMRNYARIGALSAVVDHIIPVFKYTAETYSIAKVSNFSYFGHPIVDLIDNSFIREEILKEFGIEKNKKIISLFPGSRTQEVKRHLGIMLRAARKIAGRHQDLFFLIVAASDEVYEMMTKEVNGALPVKIIKKNSQKALVISHMAIVSSGSLTLEAACLGTPMAVIYKLSRFDYMMANLLIGRKNIPFAALPNLIAQEEIVPEFLQGRAIPENIADASLRILEDDKFRENMKKNLEEVKASLGSPPVLKKIAQKAAEFLK